MEILYPAKVAKYINDEKNYCDRKLGRSSKFFKNIINRLWNCETLADFLDLGETLNGRCHLLVGNEKGVYSVDLEHPYRMLFTPDPPVDRKGTKEDLQSVRSIRIVAVKKDTHK